MEGFVKEILISESAGSEMNSLASAELVEGKGIVGDRYFKKVGTFSKALEEAGDFEVTLIESEEIEAFEQKLDLGYTAKEFRRNIVTSGISLGELIGKEFTIGSVVIKGVRYCEPCAHLAGILGNQIMEHMVHKTGLRAVITSGGEISVGSKIACLK